MKKYILLTFFILLGCTQNILPTKKEHNENCMTMNRFKVFQVFDNNYALATSCKDDKDTLCSETIVLLAPQRNINYYDDMYVSAPKQKCAVQDGVYKYETKGKDNKTVPVIRFVYEYEASSDEEKITRFGENLEQMRYECKQFATAAKKPQKDIKQCDCIVEYISDEYLAFKAKNPTEAEKETFQKEFPQKLKKKCGKLPDFIH